MKPNDFTWSRTLERGIFNTDNPIFKYIIEHQQRYLLAVLIVVLFLPLLFNSLLGKPLLIGAESYYHLSQAQLAGWRNLEYYPLSLAQNFLPERALALLPIALAISCYFLWHWLARRWEIPASMNLFLVFFIIISPWFLYAFTTLSAYGFFTFLVLLGLVLLYQKRLLFRYLAVFPLGLAAFFDLMSGVVVLLILLLYWHSRRLKKKTKLPGVMILFVLSLLLFQWLVLKKNLVLGPFHLQSPISDLVSDLGGLQGVGLFMILLAVLGMGIIWKKKQFLGAYLFVPVLIAGYLYSTQVMFFLGMLICFFAALGFVALLEDQWILQKVKEFTCLLLILGILFSTLSYFNRFPTYSPTGAEVEVLHWMKDNTNPNTVIFSAPEQEPYLRYFAERPAFYALREGMNKRGEVTRAILKANYIQELFPLLEANHISLLYLTPTLKARLPADQGLLFLLKNERFKLVHSHEGSEVWVFS